VHGCQSTVFLSGRKQPNSLDTIEFGAESDAFIVNGLIALLTRVFSGQRAKDVLAFDVDAFFAKLGLDQHLSMGRRNGLAGMISRVRRLAAANADEATIAKLKADSKAGVA
jgi:cysteine desulfurase/selenocysteine lyase